MPPPIKPWMLYTIMLTDGCAGAAHHAGERVKPRGRGGANIRMPGAERARQEAFARAGSRSLRRSGRAVCTQGFRRPRPIARPGSRPSDDDTIWMSRNAMNMPKHMARKATDASGVGIVGEVGWPGRDKGGGTSGHGTRRSIDTFLDVQGADGAVRCANRLALTKLTSTSAPSSPAWC